MNVTGTSSELREMRNMLLETERKTVAENLTELCSIVTWKAELLSDQGIYSDEIYKQYFKCVAFLLLVVACKRKN